LQAFSMENTIDGYVNFIYHY
jgi:hypothetical protein